MSMESGRAVFVEESSDFSEPGFSASSVDNFVDSLFGENDEPSRAPGNSVEECGGFWEAVVDRDVSDLGLGLLLPRGVFLDEDDCETLKELAWLLGRCRDLPLTSDPSDGEALTGDWWSESLDGDLLDFLEPGDFVFLSFHILKIKVSVNFVVHSI